MKVLLFIISILYASYINSQTCIVAVREKNKITVGADSRLSSSYQYFPPGSNKGTTPIESTNDNCCKIVSIGNFNITLSANIMAPGCLKIARDVLPYCNSFKEVEDSFHSKIMTAMLDTIKAIVRGAKAMEVLNQMLPIGMPLVLVFIFGIEKDTLEFRFWILSRVHTDNRWGVKVQWDRVELKDSKPIAIGETNEIYSSNMLNNKSTWEKGTMHGIDSVIAFSKKFHPDHVGGKVDIIEVTTKGTKWLRKKQICN